MSQLIRNRVTERDIRQWLDDNGYEGGSATLESVELYAIKRPGWRQLFRFSGKVRLRSELAVEADDLVEATQKLPVWGVVLDDERKPRGQKTQVALFDSEADQLCRLELLSADMITANKSDQRPLGIWSIVGLALFCAALLFLVAMLKSHYE